MENPGRKSETWATHAYDLYRRRRKVKIIADGHTLVHLINGHVMSVTIDNDAEHFAPKGLIAFEIEGPGVVKISHRNVWLKELQ
jgi:hypothetical protein